MPLKKAAASAGFLGKWLPPATAHGGASTTLKSTFKPAALAVFTAPSSPPQPTACVGPPGCRPDQRTCCLIQPKPAALVAFTAWVADAPTISAAKPYCKPWVPPGAAGAAGPAGAAPPAGGAVGVAASLG